MVQGRRFDKRRDFERLRHPIRGGFRCRHVCRRNNTHAQWNNYFVHCAFTRYEAGLSIDEIWSYQQESSSEGGDPAAATSAVGGTEGEAGATAAAGGTTEEETVDFDGSAIPTGAAGVVSEQHANDK